MRSGVMVTTQSCKLGLEVRVLPPQLFLCFWIMFIYSASLLVKVGMFLFEQVVELVDTLTIALS